MCLTAVQAGEVQRRLNPVSHEQRLASVSVQYLPALHVGGDCGWVRPLDDHRIGVAVADVSGHGLTSSLVASRLAPEFAALETHADDVAGFAARLNRLMLDTFTDTCVYLTAFCAVVDFDEGNIRYVNCGHPAPLVHSRRHRHFKRLPAGTHPLGLFEPGLFGDVQVASAGFDPGDTLVLYTDGVIELPRPDGSELGERGLQQLLAPVAERRDRGAVSDLFGELESLHQEHPADDVLLMLLDLHGDASRDSSEEAA